MSCGSRCRTGQPPTRTSTGRPTRSSLPRAFTAEITRLHRCNSGQQTGDLGVSNEDICRPCPQKEHIMRTVISWVAWAAAPLATAAVAVAAAAPSFAASPVTLVAAFSSDDPQWDGGDPAGGTGVDAGPQTAPDLAGIPEDAG